MRKLLLVLVLCANAVYAQTDWYQYAMDPANAKRVSFKNASGEPLQYDEAMAAFKGGHAYIKNQQPEKRDGQVIGVTTTLSNFSNNPSAVPARKLKVGDTLPNFSLQTTDGKLIDRRALRGRPALLVFSSAICAPCRHEAPIVSRFFESHPEIQVLSLTGDDAVTAAQFVAATGLRAPMLANADDFMKAIGLTGFPMFALVDANQRVLKVGQVGFKDSKFQLENWVQSALR